MKWGDLDVGKKTMFLLSFVALTACASSRYMTYGVDVRSQMFLGLRKEDDKPFSFCLPREDVQFPCRMITLQEYRRLLTDLVTTEEKLKSCEEQKGF